MALKNFTPKKPSNANANVAKEAKFQEDFELDKVQNFVKEEDYVPFSKNEELAARFEEMIPKSQLDAYIQQRIEEGLTKLSTVQVQAPPEPKAEIPTKKVEPIDDLPEFINWEVRDRTYVLCTGYSSLSHGIKDRHKKNSPLMYKGRALRYSPSQASFFMDKQVGDVLIQYLSIEEGRLFVPKDNTHLQKFLAITPENGVIFKEFNPKEESEKTYQEQSLKLDAHFLSKSIDTPTLLAVASLMCKSYTESMDLKTVRSQLYNEIEANPNQFIKLANDKNLKFKSIGKSAVSRGLLKFANYRFLDEKDTFLCEVNRNENEYDVLASYFLSTEGRQLYEYLVQKIEYQ